jgi:tryptophan-rich sensory protein
MVGVHVQGAPDRHGRAFIALTWNSNRIASLLFVPYLVWVSYAAALNFAIWQLNPNPPV